MGNHERLLISVSEKIGALDEPRLTGELYAINVDGTRSEIMVGQGVRAPHAIRIRIKNVAAMGGVVEADARDHALRRSGEARFDQPPPLRSVDDLKACPPRVAQK